MSITQEAGEEEESSFGWFINASEIAPGATAVIGGNTVAFYAIHHLALWVITVSIFASLIVIRKIYSKWKRSSSKLDFSVRLPLYVAVADTLWGVAHFMDHMYLLTVKTFPEMTTVTFALSVYIWVFFGYQQLMHTSVSWYTYLRVVHQKTSNLGKWDWKVHIVWFSCLIASVLVFRYMDAFGNTGYWMGPDATTLSGSIMAGTAALTTTFTAFYTTLGYLCIRRTVVSIKSKLSRQVNPVNVDDKKLKKIMGQHQSTISQCLTTHVKVASLLYCPLAILMWINVSFQIFMGAVNPLNYLLMVIVANSSGSVNGYAYFYNEKLKKGKKRNAKFPSTSQVTKNVSFASETSSLEL